MALEESDEKEKTDLTTAMSLWDNLHSRSVNLPMRKEAQAR